MQKAKNGVRPLMVVIKGLILFLIVDLLFTLPWSEHLGNLTLYNWLLPGRYRFTGATDLSMAIASNRISKPKQPDEYRVIVLGDSSVFAGRLNYDETVAYLLDNDGLTTCSGKQMRVYNLGMPYPSALKDLMILDMAMEYKPDMVLWFVTLSTLNKKAQLKPTFVQENPKRLHQTLEEYHISLDLSNIVKSAPENFWGETLIGKRQYFASMIDLQLSGFAWAATDYDIQIESSYIPVAKQWLPNNAKWDGIGPSQNLNKKLRFDIFYSTLRAAGNIPVLVINQPIFITQGKKSNIRYNQIFPIWAYDTYRKLMLQESQQNNWHYLDLWNAVPSKFFTDSPFHRNAAGEKIVAQQVAPVMLDLACP